MQGTAYHPELGELMHWEAFPLSSDPDTQVEQTIRKMRRHVIEDARSVPVRRAAGQIQASGTGDPLSDTFWWVKERVGFRQDEDLAQPVRPYLDGDAVEVLIRPRDLANMRTPMEDCDGFSSLAPSLLLAQGVPCSFVTVAADKREPGRFSHVYIRCTDPKTGERVALDTSHGEYPGWECTESGQVTRMKEWPITGPDWCELVGIAVVLFAAAWLWGIA
jgi:hypothetical protein